MGYATDVNILRSADCLFDRKGGIGQRHHCQSSKGRRGRKVAERFHCCPCRTLSSGRQCSAESFTQEAIHPIVRWTRLR
ncbi:hypothetical protein ARMSODRAFT_279798 [Armillaria solidipes]|uniref:Uncharacterized protein n=1 Tax=Armillaria solidipes TaxID=1076256 RepID=A0A2H3C7T4_9AGAR|nr:hypothetical protein ARMSODRAFT_279798 [Armillaria solidipes]